MLPFTKRPGRQGESEEVLTKESLPKDTEAFAGHDGARAFAKSVSDDELTALMPVKSMPKVGALSRLASVPPPPRSARSVPPPARSAPPPARSVPPPRRKFMDEDEGRAALRSGPKIVKKGSAAPRMAHDTPPTTVSPQALIKATLASSGPSGRSNALMAPPPSDLFEDLADRHPADVGPQQTVQLGAPNPLQPVGVPAAPASRSVPPPAASSRSVPPAPGANSAPPRAAYRSVPPMAHAQPPYAAYEASGSSTSGVAISAPSVPPSMPAHFMVPNAPYSDSRLDPPGTVLTARGKGQVRSAASWAMALLVVGLGVGTGGVAVMRGKADGLAQTMAAFVDPTRAASPPVAAAAEPEAVAVQPGDAPKVTPAAEPAPAVAPAVTDPAAEPAAAPPSVAAAAPVAVAPSPAPKPVVASAPAPKPVAASAPAPKPVAPAPRPVAASAPAPTPAARPPAPRQVASSDEAPADTAKKPVKGGKAGKGGASSAGSDIDEETKKALEALQKSQLESSF